jgi:hypothetical protein
VGNKSDLRPEQRQVKPEEGRALADVIKAFELIIEEVEKSQNPSEPTGGNKCIVM